MSLITRCPACQTMFKVVPDQLRVSEGWVRCGQCSEIFDASQQFVSLDAEGNLLADGPPADADLGAEQTAQQPPVVAAPGGPMPGPPSAPESPDAVAGAVALAESQHAFAPEHDFAAGPLMADEPQSAAAALASVAGGPAQAPATVTQVSFLRNAQSGGAWRRPWVRAVLAVCSVALAMGLTLQVTIHERERIATIYPQAAPWLAQLCVALGCSIGPLRQIESVSIESSSLGRIRSDVFRLGFVLKNAGPLDLAMPAVELTLTDTQDQPMLRRVLLPTDFTQQARLGAGSDMNASLTLQPRLSSAGERVAGYRVLAFYP